MTNLILAGSLLLAVLPEAAVPPGSDDLKAYESARALAGRDPGAHIKLALWCEARGLSPERLRHLAMAVLIDPTNATARGLMGLVPYRGKWEDPERVSARIKADEALAAKLARYNARRDEMRQALEGPGPGRGVSRSESARAHVRLGMWCEQNGLKAEATAHFTSAVVLDPYRDVTWKHLGYVKHDGRWMSPEQIEDGRREAEAQREADRRWLPLLKSWRARVAPGKTDEEANRLLAEVSDPRAVPAVLQVFRDGSDSDQGIAVQLLGQIDAPASTRALASLTVGGRSPLVRQNATQQLRKREPRDYAGMLVEMIRGPMRYQAEPVRGPGMPGALAIETARYRMLRSYDAPPLAQPGGNFFGYIGYDENGLPIAIKGAELRMLQLQGSNPVRRASIMSRVQVRTAELLEQANLKAVDSQQRLIADVQAIEQTNADSAERNARIIPVLRENLDAPELEEDENAWQSWWYDRLGYQYEPAPKVTVTVDASPQPSAPYITSCFAAGTPVQTLEGRKAIESLRVGDHVLSQDTANGALSFQPVQVVHHNAPARTLLVALDCGETLTASIYHRFWRAGRGWAMARELEPGDVLRTREGRARVVSVAPGPVVPVYNLDVAGSRTFFVGDHDTLVHDNRLPDPRTRPFDAEPVLAAARTSQR